MNLKRFDGNDGGGVRVRGVECRGRGQGQGQGQGQGLFFSLNHEGICGYVHNWVMGTWDVWWPTKQGGFVEAQGRINHSNFEFPAVEGCRIPGIFIPEFFSRL